jgi:hypothetical protein
MEGNAVEWDDPATKAGDLANSVLFDVHKWSDFPEVNRAVDALYDEMRTLPEFSGKAKLRRKHIKVVVLNLYVAWLGDSSCWVAYYRGKWAYEARSRYNELHVSFITVAVVDAMIQLGYVQHVEGFNDRTGKRSRTSRMRATQPLLDLIHGHQIVPQMIVSPADRECIILRAQSTDEDGRTRQEDIPYEDNDETVRMRAELIAYNQLLAASDIQISEAPVGANRPEGPMPKVDLTNKFVRRIFANGSWEEGGRFYGGWWQTLRNRKLANKRPGAWRSQILINGNPTAELDFSGLHVVLLYAREGIDYWTEIDRDPYQLEGFEQSDRMRDFLKLVLLCCLFADSRDTAIKAIRKKINEREDGYWGKSEAFGWVADEGLQIGTLVDAFAESHPRISQTYFYSNYSTRLQRLDSKIAERVIKGFTDKGVPILALHDSFLIDQLKFGQLFTAMAVSIDSVVKQELGIRLDKTVRMKAKGYHSEMINEILASQYALGDTYGHYDVMLGDIST